MNRSALRFRPCLARGLAPLLLLAAGTGVASGDWPHFLGPRQDLSTEEEGLLRDLPESGPRLLWEMSRGEGHAGPVALGGALGLIHQREGREIVECRDAATGELRWEHSYPVEVSQNFGIRDAPRSSPVIDPVSGMMFTLGNDSDLIAFDLATGAIAWQVNLVKRFGETPVFFGHGSSPLVYQDTLIVNAGCPGAFAVAFALRDGAIRWQADHAWGASYASPVVGKVNGEDRLHVFAGGMTDPPAGGLVTLDPRTGAIDGEVPWRSRMFASVIASTPVPCGENRVFITEDYGEGGAMIEFDAAFRPRVAWRSPELSCQFQTPVYHEGHLYGFGGTGGMLLCLEAATGRLRWAEPFVDLLVPWDGRQQRVTFGRGSLARAEGAFLVLGENGTLAWMDLSPESGARVLSAAQLFYAPETWAPPVISGGRLFICQNQLGSRLLAYDFKAP